MGFSRCAKVYYPIAEGMRWRPLFEGEVFAKSLDLLIF